MRKKKQPAKLEVFVDNHGAWCTIHKDNQNAWIVPFNVSKKIVGGAVKKVSRDFLDSQEIVILAK